MPTCVFTGSKHQQAAQAGHPGAYHNPKGLPGRPCARGDVSNFAHMLLQGGATIEQLRQSTRANIKVERETQGCPERLICISSAAAPAQPLCPAQDALFCVQDRLNGLDSSEACLTVSHLRFCQHPRIQQPQICRLEPDGCALPFLKQGLSL